jgi:hypothetical protein
VGQKGLWVSGFRRLLDNVSRAAREAIGRPLKVSDQEDDGDGDVAVSRPTHLRIQAITATGLLLAIVTGLLVIQQLTAERAGAAKLVTRTFRMTDADEKRRLVVRCPGEKSPYGGGMLTNRPPSADGEGVYPHSYERLGQQQGYHVTAVLFDPSRASTTPRDVTLQVVCARKGKHVTPPHTTAFVASGQTKTIRATCPGRRHLFGGGFQRTDFTSRGGNYVTESRAISSKTWQVTGSAFGQFGGQLTAIAYCRRSKQPLIGEVWASTTLAPGQFAMATTPPCPSGRPVFGGFSSTPSGPLLLADGVINANRSWSASAFNYFGPAATLTAYGYCRKV